jgi:D-hydroxyproline dehydrogenase subunit beta
MQSSGRLEAACVGAVTPFCHVAWLRLKSATLVLISSSWVLAPIYGAMTSKVFDLAVIGGGVLGLAHAYAAAKAGLRVAVVERDVRANGASIRNFGFITVTGQERGESWQLACRTRDVWAEVASESGLRIEQRGLYLSARSAEATAVIEAFLATEMGEGCRFLPPHEFRELTGGLGGSDLKGGLFSPYELRVESRTAIPALTAWLRETFGVTFFNETVVFEATPPRLRTSRGVIEAGATVVCPGDDFVTLYPDRIAGFSLQRCRLSMLRVADPGLRLPGTLMSDLSLVRYRGYAALPEARALEARLRVEQPSHFDNGVHLIVAQGADGSLIVGDSHHYGDLPGPFTPAEAERDILDEYCRATGRTVPPVLERWCGFYAVSSDRTYLVDTPEPDVRLVVVTSGTGASTGFGIAEKVIADLLGLKTGAVA